MHGITAILAIILIIIIIVVLVGLTYSFSITLFGVTTETGERTTEKTVTSLISRMIVEAASENKMYIRNTGLTNLSDFTILVNNKKVQNFDVNPSVIEPDQVGTITINDYIETKNNEIIISSSEGATSTYKTGDMLFCNNPNVVLCLTFDEGSGTIVYDYSPYGNDGTLYNATASCYNNNCPTWVDGKYGKAIKFTDVYWQVLNISHSESLNINSENFTILAWVKPEIDSNFLVLLKHSSGFEYWWALYRDLGTSKFELKTSILFYLTYDAFPNNNLWQHLAVTKESTTLKLYHNGSIVNEGSFGGNADNIGTLWIGGNTASSYFTNCTIDEIIILNKSLTEEEIASYYRG